MLEKTEGAIKNEESRDTDSIGHTRHRTNKPLLPVISLKAVGALDNYSLVFVIFY
jgi:hypothetical protein